MSTYRVIEADVTEALRLGRRFLGIELNESYWRTAKANLARLLEQPWLFGGAV